MAMNCICTSSWDEGTKIIENFKLQNKNYSDIIQENNK